MTILFENLEIKDVIVITPDKFDDNRGFLSEIYSKKTYEIAGIKSNFVQDNYSFSKNKFTLRGLHYQESPFSQEKLIRVSKGSILDVAVDIRKESPTFGKHISIILEASSWQQIFIPHGFAHGFLTLETNTEVQYKVSNFYTPAHEQGISWKDPELNINWGADRTQITLSQKDNSYPNFSEICSSF